MVDIFIVYPDASGKLLLAITWLILNRKANTMSVSRFFLPILLFMMVAETASAFMFRTADGRLWLMDRYPHDPNAKVIHSLHRGDKSALNSSHRQLFELNMEERNETLHRWITESDNACDQAESSYFQGLDNKQTAYWNVSCVDGSAYALHIENDVSGVTKIMSCDEAKQRGPQCLTQLRRP